MGKDKGSQGPNGQSKGKGQYGQGTGKEKGKIKGYGKAGIQAGRLAGRAGNRQPEVQGVGIWQGRPRVERLLCSQLRPRLQQERRQRLPHGRRAGRSGCLSPGFGRGGDRMMPMRRRLCSGWFTRKSAGAGGGWSTRPMHDQWRA